MELLKAIKADFSNVNNASFERSRNVQQSTVAFQTQDIKKDRIELNSISQSNLGTQFTNNVTKISNLQITQNSIAKALNSLNSFERLVSNNKEQLDTIQPQIQNSISSFNNSTKTLSENISNIIEEKQSEDSRIYFDGILGSKPISGEEIFKAISEQKQKLQQFSRDVDQEQKQIEQKVQNTISNEKENINSTNNFFADIDFKQESVAFKASTVQNYGGSITQTQANAEPYAATELVSAS